jgi:hypothetical protein
VPSLGLAKGVRLFNEGRFFEAHEAWEAAWHQAFYPERLLYLALTKLAAGLVQNRQGSAAGARKQIDDALRVLGSFTPRCCGLDTGLITADAVGWLAPHRSTPTVHSTT